MQKAEQRPGYVTVIQPGLLYLINFKPIHKKAWLSLSVYVAGNQGDAMIGPILYYAVKANVFLFVLRTNSKTKKDKHRRRVRL